MSQSITWLGAIYPSVESIDMPKTGGGTAPFADPSGVTAAAADVASGKYFLDSAGSLVAGTASGGSATLITKNITANGTYNASSDNADGYSQVTVNVSGGASNIVTGTFTGTTTGQVLDVNVNYTGTGYPIMVFVVPTGGIYGNSTYSSLISRYAIGSLSAYKSYASSTPTYQSTGSENQYSVCTIYKNSTSAADNYTRTSGTKTVIAYGSSAEPSGAVQSLLFRNNKKFSVRIRDTSYGFASNIEYTYYIMYST